MFSFHLLSAMLLLAVLEEVQSFSSDDTSIPAARVHSDGACPLMTLFPYSNAPKRWGPQDLTDMVFSWQASVLMAMDHWNTRNNTVVPEISYSTDSCNVYFPTDPEQLQVLDSAYLGKEAVKALWQATRTTTTLSTSHNIYDNSNNTIGNGLVASSSSFPCALLGPWEPSTAQEVGSITEAFDIPHLVVGPELKSFQNEGLDGNKVGMGLAPPERAHILLQWLAQNQRTYLAIVHYPKDGQADLAEELFKWGPSYGIVVHPLERQPGRGTLGPVLDALQTTGIATVFFNFDNPRSVPGLARGLADRNMLNSDYVYFLSPAMMPTDESRLNRVYGGQVLQSPTDQLLSHALVLDILDPFRNPSSRDNGNDALLRAWKSQNERLVRRVNAQNPLASTHPSYFAASPDYFQTHEPSSYSSIIYDSVILLGLGACQAQQKQMQLATSTANLEENDDPAVVIGLDELIHNMHNLTMHGASGVITPFPEDQSYRGMQSLSVGLFNLIPVEKDFNDTTVAHDYDPVLVSIWNAQDEWRPVEGVSIVYPGGKTVPPEPMRDIDHNYLSPNLRIFGFCIMGVTWFASLGGMAAVTYYRASPSVIRAQPVFLILICVGSLVTSLAIFTLSWDESYDASDRQLDVACMATPWVFFVGHVVSYAALFCKLWRVDKVMQFQKRAVSVQQSLWPLVSLVFITLALLTLWTAMDPWTWERQTISLVPAETYGECASDSFWAFFGPLSAIVIFTEVLTFVWALKTADIHEAFGDSKTTMLAIYTHLQSWVVGIPILSVLGDSSTDATYAGRVLLIWIFSVSSVAIVVGPRIHPAWCGKTDWSNQQGGIRISGLEGRSAQHESPSRVRYKSGNSRSEETSGSMPKSDSSPTEPPSLQPSTEKFH